ncbi:hypothetical protein BT69DRAFT_617440 [Atractiella rhizophila]|nr:hypothetical protein BT69DRAFT_617440 [Atractiella rhizophila]
MSTIGPVLATQGPLWGPAIWIIPAASQFLPLAGTPFSLRATQTTKRNVSAPGLAPSVMVIHSFSVSTPGLA